jgi:hypothetical protein
MSVVEEGGKAANALIDAMKSTPMALALLVINAAFIAFFGWLLSEVAANARERNASQMELIQTLVKDCSGKTSLKPSIMFRAPSRRTTPIDVPEPAEPPKAD